MSEKSVTFCHNFVLQVKIQTVNGIFVVAFGGVAAIFHNFAAEMEVVRYLHIVYQLMA